MIFVDMNLSRQVQHVGQWAFGSSLTVNEEKRLQNEIIKKREKQEENNIIDKFMSWLLHKSEKKNRKP